VAVGAAREGDKMKPIKLDKEKDQELLEIAKTVGKAQSAMHYWTESYIQINRKFWEKVSQKYPQIAKDAYFEPETSTIFSNLDEEQLPQKEKEV
jgi:hypothetical protein